MFGDVLCTSRQVSVKNAKDLCKAAQGCSFIVKLVQINDIKQLIKAMGLEVVVSNAKPVKGNLNFHYYFVKTIF